MDAKTRLQSLLAPKPRGRARNWPRQQLPQADAITMLTYNFVDNGPR
jgi:hypothetical protein